MPSIGGGRQQAAPCWGQLAARCHLQRCFTTQMLFLQLVLPGQTAHDPAVPLMCRGNRSFSLSSGGSTASIVTPDIEACKVLSVLKVSSGSSCCFYIFASAQPHCCMRPLVLSQQAAMHSGLHVPSMAWSCCPHMERAEG